MDSRTYFMKGFCTDRDVEPEKIKQFTHSRTSPLASLRVHMLLVGHILLLLIKDLSISLTISNFNQTYIKLSIVHN